jgi:glycosyltransferase involved in cell wall biosynthesis
MMPLRALVISYAFPPVGGAGVQRVLKLVKYLPHYGVQASVLTARSPSVPLTDASLERDIPAGTEVVRVRTLEPGYGAKQLAWQAAASAPAGPVTRLKRGAVALTRRLLVPDPQVLWLPAAHVALASRLARAEPDEVVFISGPPFSQFLLAGLSRLRPGTGVVLDYRDEWSVTSSAYEMATSARLNELLERAIVRCAHAITTATEEFRAALLARFPALDPNRVVAIPNGYDTDDFPSLLPTPPSDRFVLTYCGTIFRLTSASGLMQGLRLLHAREPELAKLLEVRFVGRIVDTEARHFEGCEALGVKRLGYLEHASAIAQMAESHAALCLLDEVSGVERLYPAKIFEIMRVHRPCLALTPPGALAELVRRHQLGEVVPPRDAEAIATSIERLLRAFRDQQSPSYEPVDTERFDRRLQAAEFARVLRAARAAAQSKRTSARPELSVP